MVKSAYKKSMNLKNNTCYCFNRDCFQPKNSADAQTCVTCGAKLLLQNRYRALQVIGQGGFGRTFKGIDESHPSKPYLAIKQFWLEPNCQDKSKAAQLFEQESQHLKLLGEHDQIPALYDYFIESCFF